MRRNSGESAVRRACLRLLRLLFMRRAVSALRLVATIRQWSHARLLRITQGRARPSPHSDLRPLDDAAYAREAHNHAVMTQTSDTCPMDNRKPIEAGQFSESELRMMVEHETRERYRAECMASIQSHAVQLTLDLIVREPDPDSFFRLLMKGLLDHTESQACGVWLLDEEGTGCELWMAYVGDHFYSKESADWGDLALARQE